ncbi:flavodoxin [Paenibacillus larvae]|uniref:Flavodoxin n=1 Tax=Paenibacillus larvae TaxID=1464 RepID=A0AAP5JXM4_9BACL|nr:flavodoxin [Paenibacillus larvae]AVF22337.1 short-chain flavodoxin-like protein [Paenibacillus larvae subsp. larvae]ETK26813.1 short-chain flavodoxin-like protein [Paenibacillus larvae subsp. larvae DSM 25719]MCY7490378.1 flavodoxin [Paenibacillus larvae]MCY9563292.1 flavodoxin [Paenibacillus larvae]MCY9568127.1 flavodoxin [Paenibacillus larvae]
MSKIVLVYVSLTGNTEEMADAISEGIRETGLELTVKEVIDASANELEDYQGIILGAYTWGDGELPDEFLDFYEEMEDIELNGRISAVFGSADSSYAQFGAAVDLLLDKLNENVLEGFKIELSPSKEEKEACKAFGRKFAEILQSEDNK